MARSLCVLVAVFALVACTHALVPPPYSPEPYSPGSPYSGGGGELPPVEEDMALFNDFTTTFGRTYSATEKEERFVCFRKNLRLIEQRNQRSKSAVHGINKFADLCPDEFKARHLTYRPEVLPAGITTAPEVKASCQSIDWREKGAVTPVKDEQQCSACWAFSTIGNIEGVIAAAGSPLVQLSAQELVDCAEDGTGNMGCSGGLLAGTYDWIIDNGGINSAAAYPYRGSEGTCNKQKAQKHVATISGYMNITQEESAIASIVCKYGPVNIAINADNWQSFSSGVLTECVSSSLDYSALIVGFDLTATPPYWIIQADFGTTFGENGYVKLEYGKNLCGINQMAMTAYL